MARLIERLAIGMALLGGFVLLALVVMICISVTGRALGGVDGMPGWVGAVKGDFELVEAAGAFAIFAFLPLCQLRGGHATVDIFTRPLGPGATRWIAAFWEMVFALILILLTWRLAEGTIDKMCLRERMSGGWCSIETSFLIGFPLWWSYLACLIAAALATVTALWCVKRRITHGDLPDRPDFYEGL